MCCVRLAEISRGCLSVCGIEGTQCNTQGLVVAQPMAQATKEWSARLRCECFQGPHGSHIGGRRGAVFERAAWMWHSRGFQHGTVVRVLAKQRQRGGRHRKPRSRLHVWLSCAAASRLSHGGGRYVASREWDGWKGRFTWRRLPIHHPTLSAPMSLSTDTHLCRGQSGRQDISSNFTATI